MLKRATQFWILGATLLFAACGRTATDAAVQFSGLPIPPHATVLRFVDNAYGMIGQDLILRIELELAAGDYARVEANARAKNYLALRRPWRDDSIPVDAIDGIVTAPYGFRAAVHELPPGGTGWFLGQGSYSNGGVVLLDPARRRVVILGWTS